MSKPNWESAPEWAGWLACDEQGGWWWYQLEPVLTIDGWILDSLHPGKTKHASDDYDNKNFDETLEARR